MTRLELVPKLLEATNEAIVATGATRGEHGIVEHLFAYANPDDYRELHRLSVTSPSITHASTA